ERRYEMIILAKIEPIQGRLRKVLRPQIMHITGRFRQPNFVSRGLPNRPDTGRPGDLVAAYGCAKTPLAPRKSIPDYRLTRWLSPRRTSKASPHCARKSFPDLRR